MLRSKSPNDILILLSHKRTIKQIGTGFLAVLIFDSCRIFPSHRVFNHSEVRLATLPNELKKPCNLFTHFTLYLADTRELFQQILASDGNRSDPPIENRVNLDCETCQSWPSHSMILMASSIILGWNVLTRRSRWHFGRSGVPKPRCHGAQKLSDFQDGSIIPCFLFGIFSISE